MLDKLVGPGHAVVHVDRGPQLRQDRRSTARSTSRTSGTPPLTASTTKETYNGAGSPVGGVLGPDNNAVPSGTANSGNNSYVKQSDNRTNAVGR